MSRVRLVLVMIIVVVFGAVTVSAQTATPTPTETPTATLSRTPLPPFRTAIPRQCGNGLPCGSIPWVLPQLPRLRSPTPFPTEVIQQTTAPTNTPGGATPVPTATPAPTVTLRPTDSYNIGELENQVATLEAILNATQVSVSVDGTPIAFSTQMAEFGGEANTLFGYIKGIRGIYMGPFSELFGLVFVGLGVILLLKITRFIIPLLALFFGFIRKIIGLILEFIPG